MIWAPTTFRDWMSMFWMMLTNPPPAKPAEMSATRRCGCCGR